MAYSTAFMRQMAQKIILAARAGQPLEMAEHPRDQWAAGVSMLLATGRLKVGAFALQHMRVAYPRMPFAQGLLKLMHELPPPDPRAPFANDITKHVQVVRREGASTALVCFSGVGLIGSGVPLPMLHRWLGQFDVHLVYLHRRRVADFYVGGIPELGDDLASTCAGLRRLVEGLGASRLLCYGNSSGGFAAILYALQLEADAVLAMGPPTNMTPEFNEHLLMADVSKQLRASYPGGPLDLRPLWQAAERPPRLTIVRGQHNWDDRLYADHLADLANIEVREVAGYPGHQVVLELLLRGEYMSLIEGFLGA